MLKPFLQAGRLEAGCDEAGRGCLAGPVYAAAVVLPEQPSADVLQAALQEGDEARMQWAEDWQLLTSLLNDSKQLTEKQRYRLRPAIQRVATAWAVGIVSAAEIDCIDILNASLLAMHRAVAALNVRPGHLLIDGNRWRTPAQMRLHRLLPKGAPLSDLTPEVTGLPSDYPDIPATQVVHGDATYMAIAAASVLAKTGRDDCMTELHRQYPQYGWDRNKGYPTEAHRQAIRQTGASPWHRQSFDLTGEDPQLSLFD